MIKLTSLLVKSVKRDVVLVTWTFEKTFENFKDYAFTLYRSEAPEDGYAAIFKFVDDVQFLDSFVNRRGWLTTFYKVKAVNVHTQEAWESEPASLGHPPNLEALEIVRRTDLLLSNRRHGVGLPSVVFQRKQTGLFCDCWDDDKKRVRKSNCTECFGTKFLGGFYHPIVTWINWSPDTKTTPVVEHGETEPNEGRCLMSNYPEVGPKDVLVDVVGDRIFLVNSVETSVRRGFMLHQLIGCGFVDRNHVLYTIMDRYPAVRTKVLELAATMKTGKIPL